MLTHSFEINTYSCSMDHIILQYAWDRLPATVLALGLPKIATVNVLYGKRYLYSKRFVIQYKKMWYEQFLLFTTDGKLIEEHFGRVISNESNTSIAHMVAPSGWSEPFQNPEFDEYTIMIRCRKQIEVDGETIIIKFGESLLTRKGAKVRYSNPFEEDAEYLSVCVPAFSLDLVNREGNSPS